MTTMHFIKGENHTATFSNIIVSALILTPAQKLKLDCLISKYNQEMVIDHAANGLTYLYALTPKDPFKCITELTHTLKTVLKPNQYVRIMKHCYGENNTFWTEISDFSPNINFALQYNLYADFDDRISHEHTANLNLLLDDLTDAHTQIPLSEQHKILGLSGIREWREMIQEVWVGTNFFKISQQKLDELKTLLHSDLYDWGCDSSVGAVFHSKCVNGETLWAITGAFEEHGTLNEDYIDENDLNFDDYEESVLLIDLLKEAAEPKQTIYITSLALNNKETHLDIDKFRI